jgi:hypothetical protein
MALTYVELSIGGPISKSFTFAFNFAHGCVREATSYRSAHDRQTLEMTGQVRVMLEQQANVRQGARRDKPRSIRWRSNERIVHGLKIVDVGDRWLDRLWKQGNPIQSRLA